MRVRAVALAAVAMLCLQQAASAHDIGKNPVVLFQNEWSANYFGETNKNCPLSALPVQTARD